MSHDFAVTGWRVVDGDTVRLNLARTIDATPTWNVTMTTADPDGLSARLIILDTPERGQAGYREATDAIRSWIESRERAGWTLRVELYESAGWDRALGDLYVEGDRGDTASQFMLRAGWPVYRP